MNSLRNFLNVVFPFHFVVDEGLTVVSAGDGLERMLGQVVGKELFQLFELHAPRAELAAQGLGSITGKLMILQSTTLEKLKLRGQVIADQEGQGFVFVGGPIVNSIEHLRGLKLNSRDFPPSDATGLFISLLQAKEATLADAEKLSADLRASVQSYRELSQNLEGVVTKRTAELRQRVEEVQKLSRATDESPASVLITSKKGDIEYVNARFTQVTGYEPDDVLGRNPRILKSDLQQTEFYEELWSTILEGRIWRGELRNKKKSGEIYWLSASISPIRDAEGEITHFIGVQEDITARREAAEREKRQAQEARLLHRVAEIAAESESFDEALEQAIAGVCELGWPVGHAYVPSEDGAELRPTKIWHLDDRQAYETFREVTERTSFRIGEGLPGRVLQTEGVVWIEDVTEDPNFPRNKLASELGVRGACGFPVKLAGRVEAVLEFFSDHPVSEDQSLLALLQNVGVQLGSVLERKRRQDELRENQTRLDLALSAGGIGIWDFDPRTELIVMDDTVRRILGLGSDAIDWSLEAFNEFVHPDDTERRGEAIARALGERVAYNLEYRIVRPDGEVRYVSDRAQPVGSGDDVKWIGTGQDVTRQKLAEAELRDARARAEEATGAKSAFLANMSHEIRTPLNGIIGFTNLALRTELTDRQEDFLRKVMVSSKTLLNLINDILDFSKIEAGKLDIESVDFQLQEVLEELADLFAHRAAENNIELVIARDSDVPSALVGDPLRLRQVLVNLINNALKFTEGGEIFVRVELAGQEGNEIGLRLSVRDTGIGIPPERVGSLFESFTQVDGSTTRKYGGTGLGLTISKQLTQLMGGEIGVESKLGRGSTFWIEVPFTRQAEEREPSYPINLDLRGTRVLVVDDNETCRVVLEEMLRSFGFEVETAESGQAGLDQLLAAAAGDAAFRLVMMDWRMPSMDGLQASRRIRRTPELADLPIVMVTAFGREREERESAAVGINRFLHKPIQQSVLFDTVVEALDQSASGGVTRRPLVTKEQSRSGELAGIHVLLAEDNQINQELAVSLLGSEGITVDIANNGLEALEKVQKRSYDGVLMDMQMPELDGYGAARKIRENDALQKLPIIAMTAHAMTGDREKCLEAGMSDYVTKPIDPEQLFETLGRWVTAKDFAGGPAPTREPEASVASGDGLDELRGIDVETALGRVRGDRRLYRKMLMNVARDHAGDADRIESSLASGDLEAARATAHTLKGVAGNLSIDPLQSAAGELESAIVTAVEEGSAPGGLDHPLSGLREALGQAVQAIRSLEPADSENATEASADPVDLEQTAEVARRLREAAEVGDVAAIEKALRSFPSGFPGRSRLAALADAFDLAGLAEAARELQCGKG